MNKTNCPTTNQNHCDEIHGRIKQRIYNLSDDELESLAAHADFYQRRLNLRQTAGLVLVRDALSGICRQEQSPRPEDLSSPMAFKFYLKRVIRSLIDSGRLPDWKPELIPSEINADRAAARKNRKEFRRRLLNACRQLGEAIQENLASPKTGLSDELLKPLPSGLTPRSSCQPAGSLLLSDTGRSPLPAIA